MGKSLGGETTRLKIDLRSGEPVISVDKLTDRCQSGVGDYRGAFGARRTLPISSITGMKSPLSGRPSA